MNAGRSRWRGSLGGIILALLVVLAVSLAASGRGPAVVEVPTPTLAGQQVVPLQVVDGPGDQTLALVPVFINGVGPYAFALDTGSTRSVVDTSVVRGLGLPIVGSEEVTGAMGVETAELVQVDQWRAGSVGLPASTAYTIDFPVAARTIGLAGSLGSDVLSQYGSITIDLQAEELILHMRP